MTQILYPLVSAAQSFTDTQKAQVRANIGVYSTAEVDAVIESQVASVIKSKGSATVAQINALTGMKDGWLYNLSDSGTITLGGFSVRAGDNIRWMDEDGVWDMYQSPTDFSEYYKKSEVDTLAYKVKTSGTDLEGKLLTDKVSATGLVAKTIVNAGTADEKINLDVTPVIDATMSGSGTAGAPFGISNPSFYVKGNSVYGGTLTNNLDTLERNTPFTCYGAAAGAPDTTHSWFGWHINSNAGVVSASQMAIAFGTDLIVKYRTKSASVWGPWRNGSTIVNASTATAYTFLASDANTCHTVNTSAATTRTVPSDTTAPDIAIGDSIEVQNIGTGVVTFVAASGVTIRSSLTLVMYGQYSVCMLRKIDVNTWILTCERTAV